MIKLLESNRFYHIPDKKMKTNYLIYNDHSLIENIKRVVYDSWEDIKSVILKLDKATETRD